MSGKLYDNVTSSGKPYSIYIPDNYTSNTSILSYNFTAGHKDNNDNYVWRNAKQAVLQQGYDTIVLFPNYNDPDTWNKDYQNNSLEILADAKARYNVTSDQFMTIGFSSGCANSVKTTAEYLIQNPDVGRQIAFTQDGFIWENNHGLLTTEELNALIKNDTLIISYCQPENWDKISKPVLKNLDTLIITDKPEFINQNTSYWGRHDLIARNFFEGELYNDIIEFLNGTKQLDDSRYNFYISDNNGNKVKINDVSTLYELLEINSFNFSKTLLTSLSDFSFVSDLDDLSNYLNNIREKIRNTACLNSTIATFSGSSNTKVPSEIASIVQKYFSAVAKNLTSIAELTNSIAKIHDNYVQTDENLSSMSGIIKGD